MTQSWQAIRAEAERRMSVGEWRPGDFIPSEADLATEFRCSRATVNRALQSLAADGLLERRRRAGTKVASLPVKHAAFRVPLLRAEIEETGARYRHMLLDQRTEPANLEVQRRMRLTEARDLLHLKTLHLADDQPYCLEDRWINPTALPGLHQIDFAAMSANEVLLRQVPLSTGEMVLSATAATAEDAERLGTTAGAALFELQRSTWDGDRPVTAVRLLFPPGYRMRSAV
ncbi:UTRA domain-containing protein [Thalassococcus sp. S3]|uniref:UTRA domain-containing protein n=1 Tax=Thalassococcus sp. S3 TaxID=2017482 RepID=UPI001024809E|nr:UTRA domain-containing protein [Thalassococcus sp. S3]QBF34213.1 GntR family transcriptional regulator [Thalassococcus sp. S3]